MQKQNNEKRVVIYCRESRDDYGENYERIETQRDLLIKYCKSHGYTNIVDIIMDDDKSGTDFSRFDDIYFDQQSNSFVFTFDYKKFDGKAKEEMKQTKWSVYSKDKRIVYFAKAKAYEDVQPTEKLKALFETAGIDYKSGNSILDSIMAIGADLKDGAKPSKEIADFWDGLLYNFKLILQMRNSNARTGEDYIISPVMAEDGTFFDSREELKKGEKAKLPVDADANGAYHIALKGLSLINKINLAKDEELKKFDMKISNADWFKFAQEKDYAK